MSNISARSPNTKSLNFWAMPPPCSFRSTGLSRSGWCSLKQWHAARPSSFKCGSVSEIVDEGVSGFIVESVNEATAAIARIPTLDRAKVRATFKRRFTVERMADDYLQLYRRLIDTQALSRRRAAANPMPAQREETEAGRHLDGSLAHTSQGFTRLETPAG